MAIKPVFRVKFIEQFFKTGKALVGIVFHVAIALDRGVGDHDVDTAGFEDLPAKLAYPPFHLNFGVLILVLRVAEGSAQS